MADYAYLQLYQGDDYFATVTVTDSSGPADLSDYTAKAQIRLGSADQSPVLVTIAAAISSPDILLSIPASQTLLLSGTYRWDLQLTSSGGVVTTLLSGPVSVQPEITR